MNSSSTTCSFPCFTIIRDVSPTPFLKKEGWVLLMVANQMTIWNTYPTLEVRESFKYLENTVCSIHVKPLQ